MGLPALKSKPPAGKTIAVVYQPIPVGVAEAAGVQAAAKAIGWNYVSVITDVSNPATVTAGVQQAILQRKADVVAVFGVTRAELQSVASLAKQHNVKIIAVDTADPVQGVADAVVDGQAIWQLQGKMLADWVAADSNGKANTLFVGADALTAFKVMRQSFNSEYAAVCKGCAVSDVQLTVQQLFGDQGASVGVSQLRRETSVTYVVLVEGAFIGGFSTALSSAGLAGKVRVASAQGSPTDQTNVRSGAEGATTPYAQRIQGWLIIDAALRQLDGSQPAGAEVDGPVQLFTKDNASSWLVSDDFQSPPNYLDVFKKLWLLG